MTLAIAFAAALAFASFADAQSELQKGFHGALAGCEQWILDPSSWTNGTLPFQSAVGLGDKMGLVQKVEDVNLPPPAMRRGNHYWRINATRGAGYVLVVSDQIAMCHITGGGDVDLQPVVEAEIASSPFYNLWERRTSHTKGDMISTRFRNRKDSALWIQISRATKPNQRIDRVQVITTATYELKK